MNTKILAVMFVVFAALLASMITVSAANFAINNVQVNDVDMTGKTLNIERDEQLTVEVELTCQTASNDARVRAEINGYEFGNVEDLSSIFECNPNQTYKKVMNVQVPYDLDASQAYTLRVEVFDQKDQTEQSINLFIEEQRNNIGVFDVITNPSANVKAGTPVFVTVRVENLGQRKQDNVKITASIPELGATATGYLNDDLITEQQESSQTFNDDEEQSQSITLMLRIPDDAATGNYNINVVAEFNRGHDFVTANKPLFVQGAETPAKQAELLVNVDANTKDVSASQETTYKVMFANVGEEKGLYSIDVDGADSWGYARVEPGFLTLNGGSTGEAMINVKARTDAQPGNYAFVARVMQGSTVVKEISLRANVVGTQPVTSTGTVDLRMVLAAIFVILVIVLIVLAVVLAARKSGRKPEETMVQQPTTTTYY
ncbi:MAG: hypothetical protein Q7R96_02900 [Nanoarchaeota archaeon]|nr:hypothetical protein [Nanoarchaeota archaeon]